MVFSIGEKVYGVGVVDLNLTIGTPTESKDGDGNLSSNQNSNAVNSYVAFGSEYRALVNLPNIEKADVWEPEPATEYIWSH